MRHFFGNISENDQKFLFAIVNYERYLIRLDKRLCVLEISIIVENYTFVETLRPYISPQLHIYTFLGFVVAM